MQRAALQRLAIAYAHAEPGARSDGQPAVGPDPVHLFGADMQRLAIKTGVMLPLSDVEDVAFHVGGDDEQRFRPSAYVEALALADREEMRAAVASGFRAVRFGVEIRGRKLFERAVRRPFAITGPSRGYFDDVAVAGRQLLLQEDGQIDLADEADALRILALGRGQMLFGGDAPDFGFEQVADGEQRPRELLLGELAEEIALVLVGIAAGEQPVDGAAVRGDVVAAAVVARGHAVGTQIERRFQEGVEFDLPVAQHVRIGRAAAAVLGEHVVHDSFAVLFAQIDHMERNVEPFGHQFGEHVVVVPRAVALQRAGRIFPVAHEQADHFVSLLLEQVGRHARIDASGEAHDNFHFRSGYGFTVFL